MKKSYFSRPVSDGIKGVLLILMFAHHFFGFPDTYISGVSLPWLAPFSAALRWPLKICVSSFAFLTGYFFCLSADKGYRRVIRKLRDFLISYWIVYLPFLALALLLNCRPVDICGILCEAFGLDNQIMVFCWYVYFFCAAMLLLPLADRFSTGTLWADVLILGLFPLVVFTFVRETVSLSLVAEVSASLLEWYPCVVTGFLFAKYHLFEEVMDSAENTGVSRKKTVQWFLLASGVCLARALWPRISLFYANIRNTRLDILLNMDVFYAPLFLYAAKNLLEQVKWGWVLSLLGKIGRESMLMWFLHCLFFNCCAEYTQPLLFWPRLAILVLPWGLALCYAGAKLIHLPLDFLLGKKRRIF